MDDFELARNYSIDADRSWYLTLRNVGEMESQELLQLNGRSHLPITTCPNCMSVWLAPGLKDGDTYECRSCLLSFVVRTLIEKTSLPFDDLPIEKSTVSI
jgi:primosomal protein N'